MAKLIKVQFGITILSMLSIAFLLTNGYWINNSNDWELINFAMQHIDQLTNMFYVMLGLLYIINIAVFIVTNKLGGNKHGKKR